MYNMTLKNKLLIKLNILINWGILNVINIGTYVWLLSYIIYHNSISIVHLKS